ncbi:MAG: type I-E CRISPR-associated protein Cas6/Cse3/CasE [Phycisphaerae bacterium]|nr:type I-E CRISPR-associated protein Cas6/Cse3/CasE [Phycisphaerae bacterium]
MYHSHLLVNVGDNPDRPDWNITRRWLRNLYRVHQRLCMAFPSKVPTSQMERIEAYCAPFCATGLNDLRDLPGEPDTADAHHARSDEAGFLFRIDYPVCDLINGKAKRSDHGQRRPVIIVQSASRPDWDNAFGLNEDAVDDRCRPIGNASFLLAAPTQTRTVNIDLDGNTLVLTSPNESHRIASGDPVRFRLRANPTRKVQDGSPNGRRKRINPTLADHANWLASKLTGAAESPVSMAKFVPGWAYGWRTKHEPQPRQGMQWWSVLFEGTFQVGDVSVLKKLLESGIGPAKAFGFGLLSIAPVRV